MQTSDRCSFQFSEQKVEKICNDIRNIAALPVTMRTRSQLMASKVIPQCSYASELAAIPKSVVSRLQSAIATALWHNRPFWRSKMLIFCLLVQPCLVEPCTARAYNAIRNFWRFVHRNPQARDRLTNMFDHCMEHKHSLLFHVQKCFLWFHMTLFPDLSIGIGDVRLSILDFEFRDMKPLFVALGKQACYEHSCDKPRKDLFKPKGLIDPFLSTLFKRKYKVPLNHREDLTPHFDSQVVGCTITNDRRCAAGFVDDPNCRFCHQTKECLSHIVHDCPNAPAGVRSCIERELGTNFSLLGICEHPVSIANHRLRSHTQLGDAVPFDANLERQTVWSDGSVIFQESYWLTSAGFAVVDDKGQCIVSGPVYHVSLTSYAAELFAILQAILHLPGCLCIWSDCQAVVDQITAMICNGRIEAHWSHQLWWKKLLAVWQERCARHPSPITVQWMKAHSLDGVEPRHITDELANKFGLTRQQVLCNQQADLVARKHAWAESPIDPRLHGYLQEQIYNRQFQLANLNKIIGDQCSIKVTREPKLDIQQTSDDFFQARFPLWNWAPNIADFTWKPRPHEIQLPKRPQLSSLDFPTVLDFLGTLSWRVADDLGVGFVELLFLFVHRGYKFQEFPDTGTAFNDALKFFKKAVVVIMTREQQRFVPGYYNATEAYKCGRALPKGAIFGARPYIEPSELCCFAGILLEGCGQNLATWSFPLSMCMA